MDIGANVRAHERGTASRATSQRVVSPRALRSYLCAPWHRRRCRCPRTSVCEISGRDAICAVRPTDRGFAVPGESVSTGGTLGGEHLGEGSCRTPVPEPYHKLGLRNHMIGEMLAYQLCQNRTGFAQNSRFYSVTFTLSSTCAPC